jgi:DNA-binding NarL/FixJ family response regulator
VRIIVAEDSGLIREGLVRLLTEAGMDVVDDVGSAVDLLRAVNKEKPDVVITDIRMPPTHTTEGVEAAKEIREQFPNIGILLLSQYVETRHTIDLLRGGAAGVGYLLKDRVSNSGQFLEAVRRIGTGESVVDPEIVETLMSRREGSSPLEQMTPREREILALMAEGRSNRSICDSLSLSPKTVEGHVARIFMKLDLAPDTDLHRRVLAVLTWLRD